jgi:formylglycine-generating enzyme required for sulfatase activity
MRAIIAFLAVIAAVDSTTAAPASAPAAGKSHTIPSLGLGLMPIPAGRFVMGSPDNEPGRTKAEGPQTEVVLTKPYWMGKHEVTHGQWKAVMGTDLAEHVRRSLRDDTLYDLGGKKQTLRDRLGLRKDSDPAALLHGTGDDIPMHWVSWEEAVQFCRRLTERERTAGRLPPGYEYRLPTEAEWEYACRAGTAEATYAGKMEIKGRNSAPVLDAIAWYSGNSSVGYTGPGMNMKDVPERQYPGDTAGPRDVGGKQPNAWGLHDMIGNVWEWTGDWFVDRLPGGKVIDPTGPASGTLRVFHGGGWHSAVIMNRAAYRAGRFPGFRSYNLGFRVALVPVHAR